jgi:phosphohistidine phosphatase
MSAATRLLLVRHAKAETPDGVPDHERPLAPRGVRDAPALGRWLAEEGWTPDRVLCSDAVRARQTAQLVLTGLNEGGKHVPDAEPLAELYDTSVHQVLHVVASVPDRVSTLMVVAHEPTMSETTAALTGHHVDLPTCAAVRVELPGGWPSASAGAGTLVGVRTPRD